jgi:hypothetical protein
VLQSRGRGRLTTLRPSSYGSLRESLREKAARGAIEMKVSELIDILKQYDESSNVFVTGKPGGYHDFRIETRYDASIEQGGRPIIAIEATE